MKPPQSAQLGHKQSWSKACAINVTQYVMITMLTILSSCEADQGLKTTHGMFLYQNSTQVRAQVFVCQFVPAVGGANRI